MRLALSLGRRGLGQVWPNPAVGCVLVRDDRVVGRGWTRSGGRPHAETEALAQAGDTAKGATAYVTLEPCVHHGKTPPCAQALIDAGVSRVVSALQDPDPRVSGGGHALLAAAGIEVATGVLAEQATEANLGFLTRVTKSRPMLTLKLACSLDGRIATKSGDSRWITGPLARRAVHMMRARHDAVMIGSGTAIADDPDLTVRGLGLSERSPVRIIVDSGLKTPVNSRLGQSTGEPPVWLCHGEDASDVARSAWMEAGAQLISCTTNKARTIDLHHAMEKLGEAGLTRIFCEGGGQIAASLIGAGLVDRLVSFGAGVVIGDDGLPSIGSLGYENLGDAKRFSHCDSRQLGGDVMSVWKPVDAL